jgi:hypothetical protein
MWQVVLDEAAFHFVLSLSAARRRSVTAILDRYKENPYQDFDYSIADNAGRRLRRKIT